MSVPYNPFELLNLPLLKDFLRRNTPFLVVQRLKWPGVPDKRGFIATPYQQHSSARAHAQKLDSNEGRMVDLDSELDKILALIESSKYILYLNACRDKDWQTKVLSHYQKNIQLNLANYAAIQDMEKMDIEFCFEFGKLMARIQVKHTIKTISLFDLIK